ncbi:MAG: hypothetical protein IPM26_05535 [Saprospiraceae bacterium]|nr:hypothetical protein [Saprospiraceae bacterium]
MIEYCEANNIQFRLFDGFRTDIISQIKDCDIIVWHHHHTIAKDRIVAQQILYALEQSGKIVFPDWRTAWHFDDKLGQKYLLEAVGAPIPETFAFFSYSDVAAWLNHRTDFPLVFKLRGGAGSLNVSLVKNKKEGLGIARKAFEGGFPNYNAKEDFKENWRRYIQGKASFTDVLKSVRRAFVGTEFSRTFPLQKGYVIFQEFMPDNDHDTRIITVGEKAIGIKRMVRNNDFRASGSGFIVYNQSEIDIRCVKIAFETTEKLGATVVAYDFVYDKNKNPVIVEINYGYAHRAYDQCPGYWDRQLNWHAGPCNSVHWILEKLISKYENQFQ